MRKLNFGQTIILTVVCFLIFSSCQQKDKKSLVIKGIKISNKYADYNFVIDTISIAIDSIGQKAHAANSTLHINGSFLYYGYNKKAHCVELFSINEKKMLKRKFLHQNGPDQMQPVEAIYAYNEDSLFMFDNLNLFLLDADFNITNRWVLNPKNIKLKRFFDNNAFYLGGQPSCFIFDKKSTTVLLRCVNQVNSLYTTNSGKFFEMPFIASFNILTNDIKVLPVNYPAEYQKNYYGFLETPYISHDLNSDENRIVISYPALPALFFYDAIGNTTQILNVSTSYSGTVGKSLPWTDVKAEDKKMKLMYETANYFGIVQDTTSSLKFRLHHNELAVTNKTDFKISLENREIVLTIFDKDFAIVKENSLKLKNVIPQLSFSYKDTLYMSYIHPNTEDVLNFITIGLKHK